MKTKIIVLLFVIVTVLSCAKDTLFLESSVTFGIKEFLQSENCNTDCGTEASCEGQTVKLKGILDEYNINEAQSEFWLIDEDNDKYTIYYKVDTSITDAVFDKIRDYDGKLIEAKGVISGYDMPTNTSCDRGFYITIAKVSDIEI